MLLTDCMENDDDEMTFIPLAGANQRVIDKLIDAQRELNARSVILRERSEMLRIAGNNNTRLQRALDARNRRS